MVHFFKKKKKHIYVENLKTEFTSICERWTQSRRFTIKYIFHVFVQIECRRCQLFLKKPCKILYFATTNKQFGLIILDKVSPAIFFTFLKRVEFFLPKCQSDLSHFLSLPLLLCLFLCTYKFWPTKCSSNVTFHSMLYHLSPCLKLCIKLKLTFGRIWKPICNLLYLQCFLTFAIFYKISSIYV